MNKITVGIVGLTLLAASIQAWSQAQPAGRAAAGAHAAAVLLELEPLDGIDLPARAAPGSARGGRFNPDSLKAARLKLELPDGRSLVALRQHETRSARGSASWVGEVVGAPGSLVVVTEHEGHASGFVHHGDEVWELQATGPGRSRLFRVDTERLPEEGPRLPMPRDAVDALATSAATAPAATAADLAVQDLLIVYTPAAAAANGGAAGLESMARSAVAAANAAYSNSRVNIQLNLVGLQQISYVEDGSQDNTLSRLRGTTDGYMDGVHALRDQLGADIVTILSNDGGYCGTGYFRSSSSTAFSVVAPGCLSNHTLAHEIGHNQGNDHDRLSTSATSGFNYGYRTCDNADLANGQNFRTVMAYPCGSAPRVNYFSNPNVLFNGVAPMGIAYESNTSKAADNARAMNATALTVAGFRNGGGSATPVVTVPASPSSLVGSLSAATSVQLRWADASSNESGFVLQQAVGGGAFADRATLAAGTVSFIDTGLTATTTYAYRVRAYNSAGASAYSNTATVVTQAAPAAPAAPSAASATLNGKVATIAWANVSGETGFDIVRESLSKNGTWSSSTYAAPADATSYALSLGRGTFRFKVRAVNAGGASADVSAPCTGTGCNADGSVTISGGRTR